MRLHTGVYGNRRRVCTESASEKKKKKKEIPCRIGESNLVQRHASPTLCNWATSPPHPVVNSQFDPLAVTKYRGPSCARNKTVVMDRFCGRSTSLRSCVIKRLGFNDCCLMLNVQSTVMVIWRQSTAHRASSESLIYRACNFALRLGEKKKKKWGKDVEWTEKK